MAERSALFDSLISLHPRDTARMLESREPADVAAALEELSPATAVRVLSVMRPEHAVDVLLLRDEAGRVALLEAMPPDAASDLLEQLDDPTRDALMARLDEQFIQQLEDVHDYPADTAGGMMRRDITTLGDHLTVESAIATLRRAPRERLHYLYVTDVDRKLVGVLPLRELILARARQPIRDLVPRTLISVTADAPRARVIQIFEERKLLALPVVDHEGRLLGVVTSGDAITAGHESGMEAFQKTVGAGADETALSPVSEVVRKRLPWLAVNLLTAFAAAAVVGLFEDIIAKVTALAVLLPVVSGQGGNSGSQSLAIVMRGLALREILPGMVRRVVLKELVAGFLNGIAIAIICAGGVYLWSHSGGLALVIGLAMIVNMAAAALAGAVIPLILRALGQDPAQASSIILTTVTDIVGFASFLGFAVLMVNLL